MPILRKRFRVCRFRAIHQHRDYRNIPESEVSSGGKCKNGQKAFSEKLKVLCESTFLLTKMIGKQFCSWGPAEIEALQKKLADYAPATWPLNPVIKGI